MVPWAFGLTRRLVDLSTQSPEWNSRREVMLSNFRVPHVIRKKRLTKFIHLSRKNRDRDKRLIGTQCPTEQIDRAYWEASGQRHNPIFYETLRNSSASGCFGGKFSHSTMLLPDLMKRVFRRLGIEESGSAMR